jgi:hypothetical protein
MEQVRATVIIQGERAAEVAQVFRAWFLDGGGDDGFYESICQEGIEPDNHEWELVIE